HHHDHDHGHHHHHEHHGMEEIRSIIRGLNLPDSVKDDIGRIYDDIASAESRVHGTAVSEIHLHEVGMLDAIADIASVALLIHMLSPDEVAASPVTTGFGTVHCAHGILPVPAPATALLLEGLRTRAGHVEGELCTPTGAALVRYFVKCFGTAPDMTVLRSGYGMGKREFPQLNCVRAVLGREESPEQGRYMDMIVELSCTVDDMTGEEIGFAVEECFAAGAADVWTYSVQMKKNRPGTVITVLCGEELREAMTALLFKHTSTIGIRETLHRRCILERTVGRSDGGHGDVRVKRVSGYGTERAKPEYEDLAAYARKENISLREARERAKV
ncbi:MAG: LarC family nickel insertion protein, partial [Lachnospiraceae bacterium]|nr:LarC family nickel insertion protein [Lachnospiraceae bacterium]